MVGVSRFGARCLGTSVPGQESRKKQKEMAVRDFGNLKKHLSGRKWPQSCPYITCLFSITCVPVLGPMLWLSRYGPEFVGLPVPKTPIPLPTNREQSG